MKKVILYSFLLLSVALAMANVIDTSTMDRANEPISNLKASVSGQDVTLSWDAPMATKSTQTVVLIDEEFENGAPEGWSNLDEDADGYNWEFEKSPYISGHSGYFTSCARSASYHETADELTPDNYLITKELNLKNEGTLSFWVSATSTILQTPLKHPSNGLQTHRHIIIPLQLLFNHFQPLSRFVLFSSLRLNPSQSLY